MRRPPDGNDEQNHENMHTKTYNFLPPLLARCLAGPPAFDFLTELLVMVVAGIDGKLLFAALAFPLMVFHIKHHRKPHCWHNYKVKMRSSGAEKFGARMPVGFCSRTTSVPRAFIIWLAPAVKVVRPAARRLHLDRVRFAMDWHLGITLGVCMSSFKIHGQFRTISGCCLRRKTI
jgi:hypothetical protein